MNRWKLAVALLMLVLIAAFFVLDLGRYLDLENIKQQQATVQSWYVAHPWRTTAIFFLAYVVFTTTSVPGGAVMAIVAGAIFGVLLGTVLVSFASTIGATLALLISRFLFRDSVRRHFGARVKALEEGMARDGAFYLFSLRLVPVFPFLMVNVLMGVTPIRPFTYYWVSQIGMLPGTLIYVNAGTALAQIESARDVLSPALIVALTLLGIFPLLARKGVDIARRRRPASGSTNG